MDHSPSNIDFTVKVEIQTDSWGWQTSWNITQSGTLFINGSNYMDKQLDVTHKRIPYGCYNFTVYDSGGNGMCCLNGDGYYKLFVNNELEFEGGDGDWSERSISFCKTVEG